MATALTLDKYKPNCNGNMIQSDGYKIIFADEVSYYKVVEVKEMLSNSIKLDDISLRVVERRRKEVHEDCTVSEYVNMVLRYMTLEQHTRIIDCYNDVKEIVEKCKRETKG